MRTLKLVGKDALWIVQALAALAFVLIGVAKFGDPTWARSFAHWGYPPGFYAVIGAAEVLGGILLLVPRLASYSAMLLGAIMIGALTTHLVHHEARWTSPLFYLALLAVAGFFRWRSALPLTPASRRAMHVQPG